MKAVSSLLTFATCRDPALTVVDVSYRPDGAPYARELSGNDEPPTAAVPWYACTDSSPIDEKLSEGCGSALPTWYGERQLERRSAWSNRQIPGRAPASNHTAGIASTVVAFALQFQGQRRGFRADTGSRCSVQRSTLAGGGEQCGGRGIGACASDEAALDERACIDETDMLCFA
jgi:hypothetical protein